MVQHFLLTSSGSGHSSTIYIDSEGRLIKTRIAYRVKRNEPEDFPAYSNPHHGKVSYA